MCFIVFSVYLTLIFATLVRKSAAY